MLEKSLAWKSSHLGLEAVLGRIQVTVVDTGVGQSDADVRRSVSKHHGNCTGRNPECTTATDGKLMGSAVGDAHMRDLGRSPGCYQKMWAHWRGVTEEKQSETLKVTSELYYHCLCVKGNG